MKPKQQLDNLKHDLVKRINQLKKEFGDYMLKDDVEEAAKALAQKTLLEEIYETHFLNF